MFQVCRTCLGKIHDSNYLSLTNNAVTAVIKSHLALCVPEMIIDTVSEPVICNSCITALHASFNFKYRCLQTEERIREYVQKNFVNNINLYDMISDANVCKEMIEYSNAAHDNNRNNLDNINCPINNSTNGFPSVDAICCESFDGLSQDNQMPTLERMDEVKENQMEYNNIFNRDTAHKIDCSPNEIPITVETTHSFNLKQWTNFEKNHLNVCSSKNFHRLLNKSKKNNKEKPTEKQTPSNSTIRIGNNTMKQCSVILTPGAEKTPKSKTSKTDDTSSSSSNYQIVLSRCHDNTINNASIRKCPPKKKYNKNGTIRNALYTVSKSRNMRFKCKTCKYSTNIEIDMELHTVMHVTLNNYNEWNDKRQHC